MLSFLVLVLNQNYEPLNVCSAKRAFLLLDKGKAEVIEHSQGVIRSVADVFPLPSVVRMVYLVRRPRPRLRLSRREVFARDRYTCQYCGRQTKDLTLDHVVPRYKGGKHIWENLVSACKVCNHKKAGRTPTEARMKLLHQPFQPQVNHYYMFYQYLQDREGWQKFIPEWERR
jgi:5-methylcytosine-specific restriction endonuclease McrA